MTAKQKKSKSQVKENERRLGLRIPPEQFRRWKMAIAKHGLKFNTAIPVAFEQYLATYTERKESA